MSNIDFSNPAYDPSVVIFDDGSQLVTITQSDGSSTGVWVQRFDADGNEDGLLRRVNETAVGEQKWSETVKVSEDKVLVYWMNTAHSNGFGWVRGQYLDANGDPIGDEFELQPPEERVGLFTIAPEVVVLNDGEGTLVATWSEYTSSSSVRGVWVSVMNADGTPKDDPIRFFAAPGYAANREAEVLALNNGDFVVSWTAASSGIWGTDSGMGIFAQVYAPDGSSKGTQFHVNSTVEGAQTDSQMLVTDEGFMATWLDGPTKSLRFQHFKSDGTVIGREGVFDLSIPEGRDMVMGGDSREILRLDSGNLAISWQTTDGGLYVQIFDVMGNALSAAQVIETGVSASFTNDLNQLNESNLLITWEDSGGGVFQETLTFDEINATGQPIGILRAAIDAQPALQIMDGFDPSEVIFADGSRLVTVTLPDAEGSGIWVQKFDEDRNPISDLLPVNSTISSDQKWSETVKVSEDKVLVYWMNTAHSNGFGWVRGQYLDANGDPIGDEFELQPPEERVGLFTIAPEVVVLNDGEGTLVATWSEFTSSSSVRGVWVSVMNADGTPKDDPIRFFAAPGYAANREAEVAALSNGNFVVSWTSGPTGFAGEDGDFGILLQIFEPNGARVGDLSLANSTTAGTQRDSQIIATDNGFMVTWLDETTETLRFQHYTFDGEIVGVEGIFPLNMGDSSLRLTLDSREIERLESGEIVVSWQTTDGLINVQVFSESGEALTEKQSIDTGVAGTGELTSDLTPIGADGVVVTWENVQGEIFTETLAFGDLVNESRQILETTLDAYDPSVVVFEDGSQLVTITQSDGSSTGVWVQRFDADGNEDGLLRRVNETAVGEQKWSEAVKVSEDKVLVYWMNTAHSNGFGWVRGQYVDANGDPTGDEFELQPPEERVGLFTIAPEVVVLNDGEGTLVATWSEYTSSSSVRGVWVSVMNADGTPKDDPIRFFAAPGYAANREAEVAALSNGNFVVSWTSGPTGFAGEDNDFGVMVQVFTPGGERVGDIFLANTTTVGTQNDSQIVSTDDGFIVTWLDQASQTLRFQSYDLGGEEKGAEGVFELSFAEGTVMVRTVDTREIEQLESGDLAISWQTTDGHIYVQIFDQSGRALTEAQAIDTETTADFSSDLNQLDETSFLVTWEDAAGDVFQDTIVFSDLPISIPDVSEPLGLSDDLLL